MRLSFSFEGAIREGQRYDSCMLPPSAPLKVRYTACALILGLLASCATVHFTPDRKSGFVPRDTAGHHHFVYLPADWTADKSWPVILYLHGAGERGTDGVAPTQVGLGPVAWKSQGKLPFIVVFPQCPGGSFWPAAPMRERALAALDDAVTTYHGDPSRIYVTGNSLGGYGTWALGAHNPGRFAALVPIAGGVRPPVGKLPADPIFKEGEDPELSIARRIGHTPVWIFHGARDWLVSPDNSRRMFSWLKQLGGDVRYSELPDVGHESEVPAYAMPELFNWLLTQHL